MWSAPSRGTKLVIVVRFRTFVTTNYTRSSSLASDRRDGGEVTFLSQTQTARRLAGYGYRYTHAQDASTRRTSAPPNDLQILHKFISFGISVLYPIVPNQKAASSVRPEERRWSRQKDLPHPKIQLSKRVGGPNSVSGSYIYAMRYPRSEPSDMT